MNYDVIVIGGGHAGTEAAAAAARMGATVALLTHNLATIGAMSCNPAIGGLGKGHLVREVDALDGIIGKACDAAAIHYRMLNRSKGPAVHGPRIQADRRIYAHSVLHQLKKLEQLTIIEASVERLVIQHGAVCGVALADRTEISAKCIVLASGTFLNGHLFTGRARRPGGRIDERSAMGLGTQLRELGLPIGRLKTGTPPRLDGRTIDWSRLDRQASDHDAWTMSPLGARVLPQLHCAATRTTFSTHDIIRRGMADSPLAAGAIEGAGPRYCPSIEDKVLRFGDRHGHQIFLEPEGLSTNLVYPNGLSTSLPVAVQHELVRTIPGLECVDIAVPGYAVEYDYLDPRTLDHRLALPQLPGLFCAGQINGTTGYEEAAGQGLVAGVNAAAEALVRAPLMLSRQQAYLAVMVDDLVLQGATEPYRMLTSRAEHRLSLRADNAATRLTDVGIKAGCVGQMRTEWWMKRCTARAEVAAGRHDDAAIAAEVALDRHYAPYIAKQRAHRRALEASDSVSLAHLDWAALPGVSAEMVERFTQARPADIGEARRIRGITPAALAAVLVEARRAQ